MAVMSVNFILILSESFLLLILHLTLYIVNHLFLLFWFLFHTWTAPSNMTDRLSLSSMSEFVSVQSDSGIADPRTMITWPGAKVAQWLCLLLMDCTFMLKNRDSFIFELGDCFITQGSPC